MAGTPTVYVICDNNCKFEGMTKEQILTAIMQAVESGEIKDVDAGFVSTIKTINGQPLKFFVGEQAAYDALTAEQKKNLFAIITNDVIKEDILAAISELQTNYKEFSEGLADGTIVAANATNATNATVLNGCTEAEFDKTNGGFIITEAGVYLLIGYIGDTDETYANMRVYENYIVAIPFVDRQACGGYDGTAYHAAYSSYDILNEMYNPDTYRLNFTRVNVNPYKAIKIMSL